MMKAIQVAATGDVSVLKHLAIPKPCINASQILVQNQFSGVNFIDTYHRTGLYQLALPFVPGRYLKFKLGRDLESLQKLEAM
jgi:NADPH2:quinone reductase